AGPSRPPVPASRVSSLPDQLDLGPQAGGPRQPRVAGHQRRADGLGKGDVKTVVEADVVAQLPGATDQMPVRDFLHPHFEEVAECIARLAGADLPAGGKPSQSVPDLGADEGGSPDPVLPPDRVFGRLTVLARTQELDQHG